MNSRTMVVKKTDAKKPFEERWSAMAPKAQGMFYRMKCAEMLTAPRYDSLTLVERQAFVFMRDNMKPMMNGKAHSGSEKAMVEKVLAESFISC